MPDTNPPVLHHERLDVYQASIEFLVIASRLVEQPPRGYSALAEQLRKASTSVPLNIAEGYGKRTRADRARFFDIARGSAHECAALLDAFQIVGGIEPQAFATGKSLLYRIVAMLVKLSS